MLLQLAMVAMAVVTQVPPAPANASQGQRLLAVAHTLPLSLQLLPGLPAMQNHAVKVGDLWRDYYVHLPRGYREGQPTPVVMVFHGAAINARIMARFSGMNHKADEAGFIVVYPNGMGVAGTMLAFNSGNLPPEVTQYLADDVAYVRALLDDLERRYSVDRRRIYSCGISNGGMMSHRLAMEMADRIAAIAAVGGTLTLDREDCRPARPVPVLQIHGLSDWIVPYEGVSERARKILPFVAFKSVDETIATWVELNHCDPEPVIEPLPDRYDDGTVVTRWTYPPSQGDAEVVLYRIAGGGHTWPGHKAPLRFLGRSSEEIDANDVIWEFFQRHALPEASK